MGWGGEWSKAGEVGTDRGMGRAEHPGGRGLRGPALDSVVGLRELKESRSRCSPIPLSALVP